MGSVRQSGGLVVVLVDRYRLKVLGLEHLIAIEAAHVINTITPCQDLGAGMLADLHKNRNIPLF